MESVPSSSSSNECDSTSIHSDESKLLLKDAIVYLEQLLLENDFVAQESSGTLSHKAIQIGEEMYASIVEMLSSKVFVDTEELIMAESNNKDQFEEVQEDDYSDEYMLQQETKVTDYIPLEYKIKIVNMAKEHPKWSLKTLQKKEVYV